MSGSSAINSFKKSTETNVDYKSKIEKNTIKLLKSIMILIHEPACSNNPFASINESLKGVVNINQKDNESLVDYSKCLKQGKDIWKRTSVNKYWEIM